MVSNTSLVESLKRIQDEQRLTDGAMAQKLGCTRQLYQATKTGKISLGLTILKGSTMAFPELIGDAIFFLTNDAHIRAKVVDACTTIPAPSQSRILGALRGFCDVFHRTRS